MRSVSTIVLDGEFPLRHSWSTILQSNSDRSISLTGSLCKTRKRTKAGMPLMQHLAMQLATYAVARPRVVRRRQVSNRRKGHCSQVPTTTTNFGPSRGLMSWPSRPLMRSSPSRDQIIQSVKRVEFSVLPQCRDHELHFTVSCEELPQAHSTECMQVKLTRQPAEFTVRILGVTAI